MAKRNRVKRGCLVGTGSGVGARTFAPHPSSHITTDYPDKPWPIAATRMAFIDGLPPECRAVIHEHGLGLFKTEALIKALKKYPAPVVTKAMLAKALKRNFDRQFGKEILADIEDAT